MRRKKIVLMFIIVLSLLIFMAAALFISMPGGQVQEEDTEVQAEERKEEEPAVEETVRKFAEVIYTYDTSERMFYEGAEEYMSQEAYEAIVPMSDGEDGEFPANRMVSELKELTCYFRTTGQGRAESIAVVWYRLSGSGNFGIRQIVELSLVQEDGWKIDRCTVLDTMEQ